MIGMSNPRRERLACTRLLLLNSDKPRRVVIQQYVHAELGVDRM